MNTAIVKIGVELCEFLRVATWTVPLTQWLYFAWLLTIFSIMGDEGDKYSLSHDFAETFLLVGYLVTLLCLFIAIVFFIKNLSVKNLVAIVLNTSWLGFPIFALLMGWGH